MQIQLLVERGQNECSVNLAGKAYLFKRNERGALVSEITDGSTLNWVTDPRNPSFAPYTLPEIVDEEPVTTESSLPCEVELKEEKKVIEEKVLSPWSTGETVVETVVTSEISGAEKQVAREPDPEWPPPIKKGVKQAPKART